MGVWSSGMSHYSADLRRRQSLEMAEQHHGAILRLPRCMETAARTLHLRAIGDVGDIAMRYGTEMKIDNMQHATVSSCMQGGVKSWKSVACM